MRKILFLYVFILLLSSAFISCQKSENSELRSCSKTCKNLFESAIAVCGAGQNETETTNCKVKVMSEYNDCVQKCNDNYMRSMNR